MELFWKKKGKKARSLEDIAKSAEVTEEAVEKTDEVNNDEEGKCESEKATQDSPTNVKLNPLDCFGFAEDKTEPWLIKCVKAWHYIALFLWFVFGALTFAPILFISNKVEVVFKDKIKSLIAATIIYVVLIVLIVVLLATRDVEKAREVAQSLE